MNKILELNLMREILEGRKRIQRVFKFVKAGYGVIALVFVLMAGDYVYVSIKMSQFKTELVSQRAKIEAMKSRHNINGLLAEWKGYSLQVARMEELANRRTNVAVILRELSHQMPPESFLSKFSADERAENRINIDIVMTGKTRSGLEVVNEFMDRANKNTVFSNGFKLETQEKMTLNGQEAVLFRLSVIAKVLQ